MIVVEHVGNHITVEFDDEEVIVYDDATFSGGGMVGLWTKADAATLFDNINVEEAEGKDEDKDDASKKEK